MKEYFIAKSFQKILKILEFILFLYLFGTVMTGRKERIVMQRE